METCNDFLINDEEFVKLEKEFGQLAKFASWDLIKRNTKNSHTDDLEDINQELIISFLKAGYYHKRQVYIKKCIKICGYYAKDKVIRIVLKNLKKLWKDRTRHGANKQKFGKLQESILETITQAYVPKNKVPNKKAPLEIDKKFTSYCKAIAWNAQKSMGRKITKERSIRNSCVSLSEHSYLAEM